MRMGLDETRGLRSRCWTMIAVIATAVTVAGMTAGAQGTSNGRLRTGVALFEQGDYVGAKAALSSDASASTSYYLGRIAVIEDRPEDAVGLFERAIKADGRNADYHLWLGLAVGLQAREAGRFRQAMLAGRAKGEFERAVALNPRSIGAREGLVQFYSMAPGIAGGSMRRAREHATEIARVSPMRGHLASGTIREREKDYPGAEREYLAGASLAPDSAAPLLALGA